MPVWGTLTLIILPARTTPRIIQRPCSLVPPSDKLNLEADFLESKNQRHLYAAPLSTS